METELEALQQCLRMFIHSSYAYNMLKVSVDGREMSEKRKFCLPFPVMAI